MKRFTMKFFTALAVLIIMLPHFNCKKQDEWLDVKRNKADVVPQTLADFQAILDNTTTLTSVFNLAGAVGTDDIYINDVNLAAAPEEEKNLYQWKQSIWSTNVSQGWNNFYTIVEYANIVLDGLGKLKSGSNEYNFIKGQALFWRAYAFYYLAQTFAKPYSLNNASNDLGIPLRITSDVNVIYGRATVQDTYNQIIDDVSQAITLLPSVAKYQTRPIKSAAMILVARILLNMDNFEMASKYADQAIRESGVLLDFNNGVVNLNTTYRFPANGLGNPEVLFLAFGNGYVSILPTTLNTGFVDQELYNSYDNNDLRKIFFYAKDTSTGLWKIRGTYSGSSVAFSGISINEAYLIRAECYARSGKTSEAMQDINTLLVNRFKTGTFKLLTAQSADVALQIVLAERRKELAFTGIFRWEDLRRLNKDPKFAKTLFRTINGQTFSLPPNDPKYTLPIPDSEIQITGIQQNNR